MHECSVFTGGKYFEIKNKGILAQITLKIKENVTISPFSLINTYFANYFVPCILLLLFNTAVLKNICTWMYVKSNNS